MVRLMLSGLPFSWFSISFWMSGACCWKLSKSGVSVRWDLGAGNRRREFLRANALTGNRLHDRGRPAVAARGQGLHGSNLALDPLRAFAVALVDHEHIGDLHDSCFDGLHIVAHARHKNDDGDIRQPHNIDFVLSHADRLNQDTVAAGRVKDGGHIGGRACQAAERSARSHAADIDSRIGMVVLHADAVAQNRPAGIGAGGIDRDNPDGVILLAIMFRELIDQRALARPRRSGQADHLCLAGKWEQRFEQLRGSRSAVFDGRDRSRQRQRLTRAETFDLRLGILLQGTSVKQGSAQW